MTVMISGGFDPLHVGHLDLIEDAHEYGDVMVALNSDQWLVNKKGYCLMSWAERAHILSALKDVDKVVSVDDVDGTVCHALEKYRPHYFANGGDRNMANIHEHEVCNKFGIIELFGIGGGKTRSSSEIIKKVINDNNSRSI